MEKEKEVLTEEVKQEDVSTITEEKETTQENVAVNSEEKEEKQEEVKTEKENYYERVEIGSIEEVFTKMEANQKSFSDYFKKNKKINTLIMVIFMAVIMLLVTLLGSNSGAFMPLIVGLMVAYFVVLTIFSKKTKKKLNEDAEKVILEYSVQLDSLITKNDYFTNISFNVKDKLPQEYATDLKIIKNIFHVGGRDVIKGELLGVPFVAGDLLIKTQELNEKGKNQQYIVFLGKLFVLEQKELVKEGRAIIYLKGKGANGPTDIEDLTKREGLLSEKYDVYASCEIEKLLTDEVKSCLEAFEINEHLIDMFITIDENKFAIGFSYADSLMSIPLFDPVVREAIIQYNDDVERMVALFEAIKK